MLIMLKNTIFVMFLIKIIFVMKEKVIQILASDLIRDFLRWFRRRVGRIKSDSLYEAMFDTVFYDNKIRVFVDVPFSCWNYFGTCTLERFNDVVKPKYVLKNFKVDISRKYIRFYFERHNCVLVPDVYAKVTDISPNDMNDVLPF